MFDLNLIFKDINFKYFNNSLSFCVCKWGAITYRKFGHYDFKNDEIVISSSLSLPEVPKYVIEYVMYHEMLHKFLGFKKVNGKRFAHTSEFKKVEMLFPKYKEAEKWINDISKIIRIQKKLNIK